LSTGLFFKKTEPDGNQSSCISNVSQHPLQILHFLLNKKNHPKHTHAAFLTSFLEVQCFELQLWSGHLLTELQESRGNTQLQYLVDGWIHFHTFVDGRIIRKKLTFFKGGLVVSFLGTNTQNI